MKKFLILLAVAAFIFSGCQKAGPQFIENEVVSVAVKEIPFRDVNSQLWSSAPVTRVKMLPQNVIPPHNTHPSIDEVQVRSVHASGWIAFLLEWNDSTRNAIVDADKFVDQVAIQLPLDPKNPQNYMMGNKGGRVHIIHWKAIWQDDIELGYRDVQNAHPNYWVDMYHFHEQPLYAEGEFPQEPYAEQFKTPEELNYMPGLYARNPVSVLNRTEPVEEAMAEGFGTFTTHPRQNARGWGKWENGKWRVIIARPLISDDANDAPLADTTSIAFAVWNGEFQNVGARKHYAPWMHLIVK